MAQPDITEIATLRRTAVRRFVRETYGVRGAWALHRHALGLDLLRAPVNVALAPIFLLIRLTALVLALVRLRGVARWLMRRHIFLDTAVARQVAVRLRAFLDDLDARGIGIAAGDRARRQAIADYVGVRSAVSEITTSLIVLATGFALFHRATPGVVSLAPNVADRLAQAQAARGFWAGESLGRMWYGTFPTALTPAEVILTGVVLAMAASVVTTFAGLIADPVQTATGIHRRRLDRMLRRLDAADADAKGGLAGEHVAARTGDIVDAVMALLRALRG